MKERILDLEKLRDWFIGEMDDGLAYQRAEEIFDALIEEVTKEEAVALLDAKKNNFLI